jgi:hypothetical protein
MRPLAELFAGKPQALHPANMTKINRQFGGWRKVFLPIH